MMDRLFVVLIIFCVVGCQTTSEPDEIRVLDTSLVSPEVLNLHGEERLAVLLYPDLVQSYRTDKVYDRETSEKDYAVITQGPDLSQAQIDHLRRLYIDLRGYDTLRRIELERYFPFEGFRAWGRGCEWKPDVVYEYWRDGKGVRVVICFGCSMWAFESGGKRYGVFGFAEDQRASGLQPMIRETTIEVFPEMMNSIPKHRH